MVELWYQIVWAAAIRISEQERIRKLYQKSWDQKIHTKWAKHGFLVHKPPDIFLVSKNCSRTEVEFLIYKVDSSIRSGTLGICNQQDRCQLKGPKAQAAQQNADEFSWWSRLMRILIIRNHDGFFSDMYQYPNIYILKICMYVWVKYDMTLGDVTAKNVYVPLYIPVKPFDM